MTEDDYVEYLTTVAAVEVTTQAFINLLSIRSVVKEHGYTESLAELIGEELDRVIDHDGPLTTEIVLEGLGSIIESAINKLIELIKKIGRAVMEYLLDVKTSRSKLQQLMNDNPLKSGNGNMDYQKTTIKGIQQIHKESLIAFFISLYNKVTVVKNQDSLATLWEEISKQIAKEIGYSKSNQFVLADPSTGAVNFTGYNLTNDTLFPKDLGAENPVKFCNDVLADDHALESAVEYSKKALKHYESFLNSKKQSLTEEDVTYLNKIIRFISTYVNMVIKFRMNRYQTAFRVYKAALVAEKAK